MFANIRSMLNGLTELKVTLDDGAMMPARAHEDDAGLDIFSREDAVIPAGGSFNFDTGVHIELPKFTLKVLGIKVKILTACFVKSKSGLYFKNDIIADGTIDVGYNGAIGIKLCNLGKTDYQVHAGDKISQLVIMPVLALEPKRVAKLEDTDRGTDRFGSTGK